MPQQKIIADLSFSDEKGNAMKGADVPVPGKWPDSILVTFEFQEIAEKTKVTVREEGIPMIMKLFAQMGWKQQFEKLNALLKQP